MLQLTVVPRTLQQVRGEDNPARVRLCCPEVLVGVMELLLTLSSKGLGTKVLDNFVPQEWEE